MRFKIINVVHFCRNLSLALLLPVLGALSFEVAVTSEAQAQSQQRRQPQAKRQSAPPVEKPTQVEVPDIYPAGAIVIVNSERRLYYIIGKGEAIRYGIAVGTQAELWMGRTFVASKAVDPRWVPVNGDDPIEGGDPTNPLGVRALYLDWSLLRIHGTPSRGSIGSAVSNGCIRMLNEDVIDLFERVHLGAPVFAIHSWPKASRFDEVAVSDLIYANPEARRVAKEREAEERAWREEQRRLEASWEAENRRFRSRFDGPFAASPYGQRRYSRDYRGGRDHYPLSFYNWFR